MSTASVDDARQIRDRAFHAFAQMLCRGCARTAAVVMLLDDLHWADDGSLDFLDYLPMPIATCRCW